MIRWLPGILALLCSTIEPALATGPTPASSDPASPRPFTEPLPAEVREVTIEQKLGAQLPLDATFEDENGNAVRLADYFGKGRPVVLQLGYFDCPMLCGYISRGMVNVFQRLSLKIGTDYDVISLSFDPTETRQLAYLKKQNYIAEYGRPDEAGGWHFLVGDAANIRKVTDAVGFQYRWIESAQQYSHPAALIVLTPEGKVSRYLFGVQFDPKTLRLSLVESSDGKIGTIVDDFILTCFQFDGQTGKYAVAAVGLMRVGAVLAVLALGITLLVMFRREMRPAPVAPPPVDPTCQPGSNPQPGAGNAAPTRP